MRKKDRVLDIKNVFSDLERKRKGFLYHKFSKYVVGYTIEGSRVKVYSNIGKYRIVKNTRSNISKINQIIVKNKIEIANKIDEYENTGKERLTVILFNICLLGGSGVLVPLTFFIGNYMLFLLSICLFSVAVITTSIIAINYYILVKEIQNLKNITGYKKEMEFKLPQIDLNSIKTR